MARLFAFIAAILLIAMATPASAKNYHGTYENVPSAQDQDSSDQAQGGSDEEKELDAQGIPRTNPDGTELSLMQREEIRRHRITGEGSDSPPGQENMYPHHGRLN